MFASLCKQRLLLTLAFKGCSKFHLTDFQCNHVMSLYLLTSSFSSSSLSTVKKSIAECEDDPAFTVSYLINSCGLSSDKALSVSKKVHFKTSLKPDSVLTLLKTNGFTDAHIAKIVMKRPKLLLANAGNTLFPKLEFLRSIGVSDFHIVKIVSANPTLFMYSLTKYIIPTYNVLKSLVGSDEMVVKAFKRSSAILQNKMSTTVVPNMNILRELGTPQSFILLMITMYTNAALVTHERFKEIIDYLKAMGFDPSKSAFVQAIHVIFATGTLEQKFDIYARWGWSEEDAISAFKYHPSCMAYSEKRIMSGMDFFVNKMGFSSNLIAKCPLLLCYSLERRIIPRCLVAQVLLYNGLIKKDFKLTTLLTINEKSFLLNYVIKFQEQVPQLRDVYDRNVDIGELGIDLKNKLNCCE